MRSNNDTCNKIKRDIETYLCIKVFDSLFVKLIKYLGRCRLIDIAPIDVGIALTPNILDDPLVLGRTSRELSSIDCKCIAILSVSYLPFVIRHLVLEELFERLVLVNGLGASDAKACDSRLGASVRASDGRRRIVPTANGIVAGYG